MASCSIRLRDIFLTPQAVAPPITGSWYFAGYNANSSTGPWNSLGPFAVGMPLGGYNYSIDIEITDLAMGGFFRFEYRVPSEVCSSASSYHTLEILPLCSRRTGNGVPFSQVDLCFDPAIGFPATLDLSEVMTSNPNGWRVDPTPEDPNTALCPDYPSMIPGSWQFDPIGSTSTNTIDPNSVLLNDSVINLVYIMDLPDGPAGGSAGTYNFTFMPESTFDYDTSDPNACERCFAQIRVIIENKGNVQLLNPPYATAADPIVPEDGIGSNPTSAYLDWTQVLNLPDGNLDFVYYGEGPDVTSPAPGLITSIASDVVIETASGVVQTPISIGDRLVQDFGSVQAPLRTGVAFDLAALPGGLHAFYACVNNNDTTADCNSCATLYVDSSSAGPPFAMNIVRVEEQCVDANDGSITITTVSGGVAPYEFSLNGGTYQSGTLPFTFSNLAPGTYSVTVRDSVPNTPYTVNDLVVDPAIQLNLSTSVSNVDPLNQTYSLQQSATGGNPPYEYSDLTVNNGGTSYASQDTYNNLQSDVIYTVGVKDSNGCILTGSFSYSTSDPITAVTASTFPVVCNGESNGSIEVTDVTGGVAPYEYRLNSGTWQSSTTFDNLSVGTYTLEVRDALGEVFTAPSNYQVTQPTLVNLTAVISGSNIVLFPSGGNVQDGSYEFSDDGINWVLSNSFPNPLVDGTYTYYTRDDNGCIATDEVTIVSNPITDASVTVEPVCLPAQGRIVFDADNVVGGSAPYQFSINGGSTYSFQEVFLVSSGTYDCWVIDSVGATYNIGNAVVEQAATELSISVSETGPGEVTVLVVGGQAPYEYNSNSTNLVPGGGWTTDPVFTGLTEGNTYYFFVRDNYGCVESVPITLSTFVSEDIYVEITGNKSGTEDLTGTVYSFLIDGNTILSAPMWTAGQGFLTSAEFDTITADTGNDIQAVNVLPNLLTGHINDWGYQNDITIEISPNSSMKNVSGEETLLHLRVTRKSDLNYSLLLDSVDPSSGNGLTGRIADNTGTQTPDQLFNIAHYSSNSSFNSTPASNPGGSGSIVSGDATQYYIGWKDGVSTTGNHVRGRVDL